MLVLNYFLFVLISIQYCFSKTLLHYTVGRYITFDYKHTEIDSLLVPTNCLYRLLWIHEIRIGPSLSQTAITWGTWSYPK